MQLFLLILVCIVLLLIAYMDFKERAVSLFLFCGLLAASFLYTASLVDTGTALTQLVINICLVSLLLALLFTYYFVKERTFKKIINEKLGLGDVLFWICLAPLFSLPHFILFFILSLGVVLLIVMLNPYTKNNKRGIPLAGYQSLILIFLLVVNALLAKHGFYFNVLPVDDWLERLAKGRAI